MVVLHCRAGTVITFEVANRYNTYGFGGHKVRSCYSICSEMVQNGSSLLKTLPAHQMPSHAWAAVAAGLFWRLSALPAWLIDPCDACAEHCAQYKHLDGWTECFLGDCVSGGGWSRAADISGLPVHVPSGLLWPHQAAQVRGCEPAVLEPCQEVIATYLSGARHQACQQMSGC